MKFRSSLIIVCLLFLTACVSGGSHRSYIISDTENAAVDEQSEKR